MDIDPAAAGAPDRLDGPDALDGAYPDFAAQPTLILHELRSWAHTGRKPDDRMLAAMRGTAPLLRGLVEDARTDGIFEELDGLLVGKYAGRVVEEGAGIIAAVIPVLAEMEGCPQNTPYHAYDVLGHTARVIDASPATSLGRWSALFHDSGKPRCRRTDAAGQDHFKGHAPVGARIARDALGAIGAPDDLAWDVFTLVLWHEHYIADTDEALRRAMALFEGRIDLCRAWLDLQIADSSAKAPGVTERLEAARKIQVRLDEMIARDGAGAR